MHPSAQAIDEDEGVRAVHEAFRLGINFYDTSPFYGATKSEAVRFRRGNAVSAGSDGMAAVTNGSSVDAGSRTAATLQ